MNLYSWPKAVKLYATEYILLYYSSFNKVNSFIIDVTNAVVSLVYWIYVDDLRL